MYASIDFARRIASLTSTSQHGWLSRAQLKVDELHTQWWGDYETLEREHGYIQWLFPIREEGKTFFELMATAHPSRDSSAPQPKSQRFEVLHSTLILATIPSSPSRHELSGKHVDAS